VDVVQFAELSKQPVVKQDWEKLYCVCGESTAGMPEGADRIVCIV
jgi:hypothetical protein